MELVRKNCPDADETIIGTMSQRRKNIRSTKIRTKKQDVTLNSLNNIVKNVATKVRKSNEAHVFVRHSKNCIPTKQESSHALLGVKTNV